MKLTIKVLGYRLNRLDQPVLMAEFGIHHILKSRAIYLSMKQVPYFLPCYQFSDWFQLRWSPFAGLHKGCWLSLCSAWDLTTSHCFLLVSSSIFCFSIAYSLDILRFESSGQIWQAKIFRDTCLTQYSIHHGQDRLWYQFKKAGVNTWFLRAILIWLTYTRRLLSSNFEYGVGIK